MSWYQKSKLTEAQQRTENFFDRNILNEQIRTLSKMAESLIYLGDLVFQTANEAQRRLRTIIDDKKLSSFPDLRHDLKIADTIAYDNPWKFAEICNIAAEALMRRVKKLERERKQFSQEWLPENAYKGLRS